MGDSNIAKVRNDLSVMVIGLQLMYIQFRRPYWNLCHLLYEYHLEEN